MVPGNNRSKIESYTGRIGTTAKARVKQGKFFKSLLYVRHLCTASLQSCLCKLAYRGRSFFQSSFLSFRHGNLEGFASFRRRFERLDYCINQINELTATCF